MPLGRPFALIKLNGVIMKNLKSVTSILSLVLALSACTSSSSPEGATQESSQTDIGDNGGTTTTPTFPNGLQIIPNSSVIGPGASTSLLVSGGKPPYELSIASNSNLGSLNGFSFIAGENDGNVLVKVIDANSEERAVSITIKTNIVLSANPNPVKAGEVSQLKASGGLEEYVFSASNATIEDGSNFRAPDSPGEYEVRVEDRKGRFKTLKVKVTASNPLSISPTQTTARADGSPVPFQITGGRPPYKARVYSGDGVFTMYGDGNANFYPPKGAMAVKLIITDADNDKQFADVTVENSIVKEECNKIAAQGFGGGVEYGRITSLNSKSVCQVAIPATPGNPWTQKDSDLKCPEGWFAMKGPNGPYTITYGQIVNDFTKYWGVPAQKQTGSHASFASIDLNTECVEHCTGRNFWGKCKEVKVTCSLVRYLACVPDDTNPIFQ
jgi:hypothetical protein